MTKKPVIRISSDLPADHWIARQLPAGTSLRGYAEDRAVSILTGAMLDAVEDAGITRAEIARVLGTTKSYVSQVLNGNTNMTLKTLGALLWAAGRQVEDLRFDILGSAKQPKIHSSAIFRIEMKSSGNASVTAHTPSTTVLNTTTRFMDAMNARPTVAQTGVQ
jgi:hypothetical protein